MYDFGKIKKLIDYIIVVGIVAGIYFTGTAVVAKVKELGGFEGATVFVAWLGVVLLICYLATKDLRNYER